MNAVVGVIKAAGCRILWLKEQYINDDDKLGKLHEQIHLDFMVSALEEALNSGDKFIPENSKYRNDFSLSIIANAILFGGEHEGYQELHAIGIKIYEEVVMKPQNQESDRPQESENLSDENNN